MKSEEIKEISRELHIAGYTTLEERVIKIGEYICKLETENKELIENMELIHKQLKEIVC